MIIKYYCHTGRPTTMDHVRKIRLDPSPERFDIDKLSEKLDYHFSYQHEMIISTKLLKLSEAINGTITIHEKENTIMTEEEKLMLKTSCCFEFLVMEYTDGHNQEYVLGPEPTIYIMNDEGKTIDKIRNGINLVPAFEFYGISL